MEQLRTGDAVKKRGRRKKLIFSRVTPIIIYVIYIHTHMISAIICSNLFFL